MEAVRCPGCMRLKTRHPLCEHCGYNEKIDNLSHQLPIGTRLQSRYEVGKALGQGGFGITYIGWDHHLEAPVAIKEFYPGSIVNRDVERNFRVFVNQLEADAAFVRNRERFLKEARTLARLNDVPEIVHIHSLFEENNTAYIVMEYLKGVDLRRYVRMVGGKLPPEKTFAILQPVMTALDRVHRENLVHRDISPDNIMLLPNGRAKLLDFGSAREILDADPDRGLKSSTEAILKHGFAPIEQYQRRGTMGPWTDVYALTATVYYCLTGCLPPDAPNRVLDEEPIRWDRIPGLTARQAKALEQGMAMAPRDRIKSVRELQQALFGLQEQPAPPPVSPPTPEPVPEPVPETKPAPKPTAKAKPVPASGNWIKIVAAVAAVALAASLMLPNLKKVPKSGDAPAVKAADPAKILNGDPDRYIFYGDGSRIQIYLDGQNQEVGRILRDKDNRILYKFTAVYNENGDMLRQDTYDEADKLLRTDTFTYNTAGDPAVYTLTRPDGTVINSTEFLYYETGIREKTVSRDGSGKVTSETEFDEYGRMTTFTARLEEGTLIHRYTDWAIVQKMDAEGTDSDALSETAHVNRLTKALGNSLQGDMAAPPAYTPPPVEAPSSGGNSAPPSSDSPPAAEPPPVSPPATAPPPASPPAAEPSSPRPVEPKKPSSGSSQRPISIVATEEETWPDHTAEETESGIVENDPVRPLREGEYWVGTRYEEYGADGNLRFVYESEYDYEGRKTLEYCYDIQGQLYSRTEYKYSYGHCTGYDSYFTSGLTTGYSYMNDIFGYTVRVYYNTGLEQGYTEYDRDRKFITN